MRAAQPVHFFIMSAMISLAACQQRSPNSELANLDNQIIANETDPALTSALEDQILVDPALTQQSNKNAVRPAESPTQAQYPLPSDAAQSGRRAAPGSRPGASGQTSGRVQTAGAADTSTAGGADCAPGLNYGPVWASRLPAAFAVYPGARLTEAAGNDRGDCRSRIVTFTTNAPPQRVLDYYRSRAAGAGYSAEHQMRQGDHILAGTAGQSDNAFYLILTPLRGGGSDVALITNGG
ncbi:MAG: hypothetical protein M3N39_08845 [Pseudomonadota bacterium]|nr:hypothetical protein [Pseudomonadota bacterium]